MIMNRRNFLTAMLATTALVATPEVWRTTRLWRETRVRLAKDVTIYVGSGWSASDGNDGSMARPFRSLQMAFDVASSLNMGDSRITVHIGPGTYEGFTFENTGRNSVMVTGRSAVLLNAELRA